jgi:hypothetical protein
MIKRDSADKVVEKICRLEEFFYKFNRNLWQQIMRELWRSKYGLGTISGINVAGFNTA